MCIAPKPPKPQPLPPPRALAKAPSYAGVARAIPPSATSGAKRTTVVNPDGIIVAAPTANLGGSSVVLGG